MAITRISETVVGSNAISASKLANGAIVARHLGNEIIELRHLSGPANVASVETRVTANINLLDSNADAIESRRVANVTIMTTEDTAIEARRHANTQGAVSSILTTNLTTSRALLSDGAGKVDFANTTADELEFVGGVTSAIQTQIDALEARRAANNITTTFTDDVIISGNLTINGDTTTANSVNMVVEDRLMMLANSVSGSPSADVGMLFNRGNQGNAAFFYDESVQSFKIADTKDPTSNTTLSPVTLSNLAVGKLSFEGADLSTAIVDNRSGAISTVFATNLTASRALSSDSSGKIAVATTTLAELNHLSGVGSAVQTQINTKDSVANVFATYTLLNANINVVQDNVEARHTQLQANLDVVQDNVAASVQLIPFTNVNTALGTSNCFFVGRNTTSDANIISVTLDGIMQGNTEFVFHHSNDTIQFKDASIPNGTIVTIFSLA